MVKCFSCDKESVISYATMGGAIRPVCQFHYKVKLIEAMEFDEPVKPICEKCQNGILRFDGLGVVGETALVTFICLNCKEYSTVKKKIDDYFKA